MPKLTKASFAAAKRKLGIKKVTKKNIGRIARAARRGGKSKSRSPTRKTRRRTTKRKTRRNNPKKRGNNMGRKKSLVQTAYKLIPTVALVAPYANIAMGSDTPKKKLAFAVRAATGYSMRNAGLGTSGWNLGDAAEGWMPYIGSKLIVLGAQKISGILRSI